MTPPRTPTRLYKYRAFNTNTLRLLTEAEVYYANPTSFNDPLDCSPTIQIDVDRKSLEKLCYRMLVKVSGKATAVDEINNHRYMSTEYGDYKTQPDVEDYYMRMLASHVKRLLYAELGGRGILSLGQRWDCPLMWSHYADEHRGLCIEYSMTENACANLAPVNYKNPRSIKISELIAWKIDGSTDAETSVRHTFFFVKAPQWRYEKEWREVVEKSGPSSAPFRVSAIYFGLRCDVSVITALVKLHSNSNLPVKFYDVLPLDDTFRLKRQLVDTDEIEASGLRSSALLDFKDVFIDESVA